MKSRILSSFVAGGYIVVAAFAGGAETVMHTALFLILPLACIWFSDAMGGYTGVGFGRGAITSTTPGCMVALCGWILLFLPVIIAVIVFLSGYVQ